MTQAPDDLVPLLLELQSQVLGQQDLLERLEQENTALKAEIAGLRSQESQCQSLLQATEAALTATKAASDAAQSHAQGLEAELTRIYASKAWRITAPLRRLRAGLPGRT